MWLRPCGFESRLPHQGSIARWTERPKIVKKAQGSPPRTFMNDEDNQARRTDRLRDLINKGSEIAGGATGPAVGAVVGTFLAGPVGTIVGGGVGAAAKMAVTAIGREVSSRLLSPREQVRVGGVFTLAAAEIVERCENGESVRDDGFFEMAVEERSDAEEVWESVLLKSQREPEEKKLPYMAHLLANLAFNREIGVAMAHQMIKTANSMTYRQLCILQLSATKEKFDLRQQSYRGQNSFAKDLYQIIYEYHDLYNKGLINYSGTAAVSLTDVNPGAAMPQALGVDLYYQMQLFLIPDGDLVPIAAHLH